MSEPTALLPDPLSGSTLAAYWSYGYDMPDDLGGGFVTGELLLRADGALLRRQTLYFPTGDGKLSPGFGPRIMDCERSCMRLCRAKCFNRSESEAQMSTLPFSKTVK